MVYYTVNDISKMLCVNPETVRRWIRNGELISVKSSNKTGNKISENALEDLIRSHPKYNRDLIVDRKDIEYNVGTMSYEELEKLVRKIVIELEMRGRL